MAGQTLEIELKDVDALHGVVQDIGGQIEDAFNDFNADEALRASIPDLEDMERSCFENEKSPDGQPWAPNAPLTIARKGHDVILHRTGRMGASLFGETGDSIRDVSEAGLTFGTSVPYGIFNQEGVAGPPTIPARPFVGIDDATLDKVSHRIADALQAHIETAIENLKA